MKKTLIAMAVLAASGAAMAQSSVTLYGLIDTSVGFNKQINTVAGATGARRTEMGPSRVFSSRWGMRGSEDLGGGLKANFVLESDLNPDDGSATAGFTRTSFVGLSGGFGEVRFGRMLTSFDNLDGLTNHTLDSNSGAVPIVNKVNAAGQLEESSAVAPLADYSTRFSNNIQYLTPTFGGFSAVVDYGFVEGKTATFSEGRNFAFHVKYVAGPVAVGFAHQNQKTAALPGAQFTAKFNRLGGTYDFGVVKLHASATSATRSTDVDDREFQVGLSAPLGPVTLSGGYARSKVKSGGVDAAKADGFSVVALYSLSKRTALYTHFVDVEGETAAGAAVSEVQRFGVGVRHTF